MTNTSRLLMSWLLIFFRTSGQEPSLQATHKPTDSGLASGVNMRLSPMTSRDELGYWGYPRTRIWIDINHDGFQDFCRVTPKGNRRLALLCTLATGTGTDERYAGKTFEADVSNAGTLANGHWVFTGASNRIWFCRTIPKSGRGYLGCIPVGDSGFGVEVRSVTPVALGIVSGRAWVDFNGDGKPDFCTLFEMRSGFGTLSCRLMLEDNFSDPITSTPVHWKQPSMRQWMSNSNGRVDFCTIAGPGNRYIDCITSTDTGAFGAVHRDLLRHRNTQ